MLVSLKHFRNYCEAPDCKNVICAKCFSNVILPAGKSGVQNLIRVCKTCFKALSSIDHTRTFDFAGPENIGLLDVPAILFVHGGGSCRAMWGPIMQPLSKHFRCFALDLPGHGSLMDSVWTIFYLRAEYFSLLV